MCFLGLVECFGLILKFELFDVFGCDSFFFEFEGVDVLLDSSSAFQHHYICYIIT